MIRNFLLMGALMVYAGMAHASLLGKIQAQDDPDGTYMQVAIMDYGPENHVEFGVYLEGTENSYYRHVFLHIPIDFYNSLFNSNEDMEGHVEGYLSTDEIKYTATSSAEDSRSVTMEVLVKDTSERVDIASKKIVKVDMQGDTATVSIESFGRKKKWFGRLGKLKSVNLKVVKNMMVYRDGVGLYGDNKDVPLGKVLTLEGLKKAGEDTSTSALLKACEAECYTPSETI